VHDCQCSLALAPKEWESPSVRLGVSKKLMNYPAIEPMDVVAALAQHGHFEAALGVTLKRCALD